MLPFVCYDILCVYIRRTSYFCPVLNPHVIIISRYMRLGKTWAILEGMQQRWAVALSSSVGMHFVTVTVSWCPLFGAIVQILWHCEDKNIPVRLKLEQTLGTVIRWLYSIMTDVNGISQYWTILALLLWLHIVYPPFSAISDTSLIRPRSAVKGKMLLVADWSR